MNHILEMLIKLLKVGMEAIDRKGLIAILTSSIGNDEMDDSEQAVMVYNELIDKLQLNILKMSTIDLTYTVILVFKKPNDTILVEMMICIFHIKRFDSELFVFKDKGWQKVSEDELQGLISKMIQVLLVDYKPSLSTLKNVVDGIQKSTDIEKLVEHRQYIGCGRNMFNLKTFKVVDNDLEIFPKTRLDLELDINDTITDKIPRISNNIC